MSSLTKLIHLFALALQLLNEVIDLALLGKPFAVFYIANINVQPAYRNRTHQEQNMTE